jgi:hypothetical protein
MRLTVAVLLAALAVPAHAGGLRHHAYGGVIPPLYGGGYTPLDCAATVFPVRPLWCHHCWRSRRAVSTWRRALRRV